MKEWMVGRRQIRTLIPQVPEIPYSAIKGKGTGEHPAQYLSALGELTDDSIRVEKAAGVDCQVSLVREVRFTAKWTGFVNTRRLPNTNRLRSLSFQFAEGSSA